jgi:hypothetical protein
MKSDGEPVKSQSGQPPAFNPNILKYPDQN